MGPGPLIAIDVVLLYTILGPLVLFAIYVLFDSLDSAGSRNLKQNINQQKEAMEKKDYALWTGEDIEISDSDGFSDRLKP